MLRREVVLLVSRALALLFAVPTAIGFIDSQLSELMFLYTQSPMQHPALAQGAIDSFLRFEGVTVVRVALQFIAAAFFWKCGPWIQHLLLPSANEEAAD